MISVDSSYNSFLLDFHSNIKASKKSNLQYGTVPLVSKAYPMTQYNPFNIEGFLFQKSNFYSKSVCTSKCFGLKTTTQCVRKRNKRISDLKNYSTEILQKPPTQKTFMTSTAPCKILIADPGVPQVWSGVLKTGPNGHIAPGSTHAPLCICVYGRIETKENTYLVEDNPKL